jgi:hemerythrin-like metal-binding protein
MALRWTEEYSVGVREIDDHHRQLFSLLNNNLKSVIDKNEDSKTIAADLKKLQEYAVSHFKAEENLFLKINYPDATAHIHEHEAFQKELQKLDTLANGTDDLARLKLLLFLSTWFTKHIMTVDKKYIPYLTGK